jgi:hypothetical protein
MTFGTRLNHPGFILRRLDFHTILVVALLLFSRPSLRAQDPNGALRGEVEDTSGARIARATVTVAVANASLTREALTNSRGEFRIEGLLPSTRSMSL